jgi:hypothetical protein
LLAVPPCGIPLAGPACSQFYAWSAIERKTGDRFCWSRSELAGFLSSCPHPWIEIKRYFCNID